ncbi:Protein of unknown function [Pyronema omphalodes CBS 100304]|uniref:Uncharacterized protein n=1 Tax=Pyronema omphalodes (strain CBS 100304) TaxID=1076935 RepID=U4KYH2_PYROM|nr:Protein of unknown function [Pyronema omphalodes CBS 100304]
MTLMTARTKTIRDRRRIFLLGSSTNLATELPAEQLTRPHTEASRRMLRANSCTEFNTNLRNTSESQEA